MFSALVVGCVVGFVLGLTARETIAASKRWFANRSQTETTLCKTGQWHELGKLEKILQAVRDVTAGLKEDTWTFPLLDRLITTTNHAEILLQQIKSAQENLPLSLPVSRTATIFAWLQAQPIMQAFDTIIESGKSLSIDWDARYKMGELESTDQRTFEEFPNTQKDAFPRPSERPR